LGGSWVRIRERERKGREINSGRERYSGSMRERWVDKESDLGR